MPVTKAESNRRYYDKNKEKIIQNAKEKIECPTCKSIISKCRLADHKKTKKCNFYSNLISSKS